MQKRLSSLVSEMTDTFHYQCQCGKLHSSTAPVCGSLYGHAPRPWQCVCLHAGMPSWQTPDQILTGERRYSGGVSIYIGEGSQCRDGGISVVSAVNLIYRSECCGSGSYAEQKGFPVSWEFQFLYPTLHMLPLDLPLLRPLAWMSEKWRA